jgi:hypothetical protein
VSVATILPELASIVIGIGAHGREICLSGPVTFLVDTGAAIQFHVALRDQKAVVLSLGAV